MYHIAQRSQLQQSQICYTNKGPFQLGLVVETHTGFRTNQSYASGKVLKNNDGYVGKTSKTDNHI